MTRRVVIWGAGGHALVVADIVRRVGWYDLIGFLDDVNPERRGEEFAHSTVLGGREQLGMLKETGVEGVIVAIGDNVARMKLARDAQGAGFELATAVHPRATVPNDFMCGGGTVIMAGAVVNPGATIGKNVIINTGATVDHGCRIGEGAHVCPGAHLAARVKIGRGAWIGIGSAIIPEVEIGIWAIVGAGSVVLRDVSMGMVAYGNPAREIRPLRKDEHTDSGR